MKDCQACSGSGYVTGAGTEYAFARACDCRSPCPECRDTGYVMDSDDDAPPSMRPCACRGLNRRIALFNDAGIPASMHDRTLESYLEIELTGKLVEVLAFIKSYRRSFPPPNLKGLLLHGTPGTGKTHMVCALLRHFSLEMGLNVRFIDFFHLLSVLRSSYSENRSEEEILLPLVEVEVLAIDELGKGRCTDWEVSVVDQLVSRRYNTGRTVLATTNFDVEDKAQSTSGGRTPSKASLSDRVGDRVYSRLVEMCQFLSVKGDDYRKRKSK